MSPGQPHVPLLTSPLHRITFSSRYTTDTYLDAPSLAAMQLCSSLSVLICTMFPSKLTSGYICTSNYNIKAINSPIKYDSDKCLSKQLAVLLCPEGQAASDFVAWIPNWTVNTLLRGSLGLSNSKRCPEIKEPAWIRNLWNCMEEKSDLSFKPEKDCE